MKHWPHVVGPSCAAARDNAASPSKVCPSPLQVRPGHQRGMMFHSGDTQNGDGGDGRTKKQAKARNTYFERSKVTVSG